MNLCRGEISIDGINVKDLDPCWLRGRAIGYISQEPVLFATSIIENIRFGRPTATDQEVRMIFIDKMLVKMRAH